MACSWIPLILALYTSVIMILSGSTCPIGFSNEKNGCNDINECDYNGCGENAVCFNTNGSYYCQCADGFSSRGPADFTVENTVKCQDINECLEVKDICGPNTRCNNTIPKYFCTCLKGFYSISGVERFNKSSNVNCTDMDECQKKNVCGLNATCINTQGSYYCRCNAGFVLKSGTDNTEQCEDICTVNKTICGIGTCHRGASGHYYMDECEEPNVCSLNATCINTQGSYYCLCNAGFVLKSGKTNFTDNTEQCEDICTVNKTICGNGTCHRGASGHYCTCNRGFTNYGNNGSPCTALNCEVFKDMDNLKEDFHAAHNLMKQLKHICLELTEGENPSQLNGEKLLEQLLSAIDELLSSGSFNGNRKVSTFLDMVDNVLKIIGPLIKPPRTKKSFTQTELELLVRTGTDLPQGAVTLSANKARLNIHLETAAGHPSYYPGFTTVSLLSYKNLEGIADGFFGGMKPAKNQSFKINSKVVTVTVSNRNTSFLKEPVNLTFYHLTQSIESSHTCAFWDSSEEGGSWSARGCSVVESNREYTVCSCNHLSSFAVLMALYEMENKFELQVITWVGLSLSLICLFICILTFSLIRSIQSPRTTIHLHLCISLFISNLIFLAGISQTGNQVGCAVVAGMLHFFYLAAFCWMCLEGIQLFRMVVLVFNTTFKTLYMMAGGYGVPAVIVAISALVNANGYGTKKYCWLSLEFIWSFFGPVCVIILLNIFFFLITVWKLAQKFTSLNPDLDNLQKIKAFVITAVAQLCVLGTMWIFGCFQFEKGTIAMSYLFTIFGSLQGAMLFVMHCLFSKQVREEYGNIWSRFCGPQKKTYSEFSNSHFSKVQSYKSSQDTGESQI